MLSFAIISALLGIILIYIFKSRDHDNAKETSVYILLLMVCILGSFFVGMVCLVKDNQW